MKKYIIRSMILSFCLCLLLVALTVKPAAALFLDQWIIDSVVNQTTPQDVLNAIPPAKTGEMTLAAFRYLVLHNQQLIECRTFSLQL